MVTTVTEHVSYLREHSIGSILRSSFKIYRENFGTLFLIYTLPALPFMIVQQEAQAAKITSLVWLAVVFNLFAGMFAFAAITVAISDMCLGERPGVLRSYRRLGGPALRRLAWANCLQIAAVLVGMLLLIVPGIIMMFRLLFTSIVATLENRRGRAALTRSAALGKGYHWRSLGVMAVFFAVFLALGLLLGLAIGIASAVFHARAVDTWMFRTFAGMATLTIYPLMFTALTLMYYDLRVRKEAYDLSALAEDLRR